MRAPTPANQGVVNRLAAENVEGVMEPTGRGRSASDPSAFESQFADLHSLACRTAHRITQDAGAADDIAQTCDLPTGALESIGPTDAVISVREAGYGSAYADPQPPGDDLVPSRTPTWSGIRCLERDPAEILLFQNGFRAPSGQTYEVYVASGLAASDGVKAAIARVLDGLVVAS